VAILEGKFFMAITESDLKDIGSYKSALKKDMTKIKSGIKMPFSVYGDVELDKRYKWFLVTGDDNGVRKYFMDHRSKLIGKGICLAVEDGTFVFERDSGNINPGTLSDCLKVHFGSIICEVRDKGESEKAEKESSESGPHASSQRPANQPHSPSSSAASASAPGGQPQKPGSQPQSPSGAAGQKRG
jgi:hypothetical protein